MQPLNGVLAYQGVKYPKCEAPFGPFRFWLPDPLFLALLPPMGGLHPRITTLSSAVPDVCERHARNPRDFVDYVRTCQEKRSGKKPVEASFAGLPRAKPLQFGTERGALEIAGRNWRAGCFWRGQQEERPSEDHRQGVFRFELFVTV